MRPTSTTPLQVQLPTENERERALNDLLLQIAVQEGDEEAKEVIARQRQQERGMETSAGRGTDQDDLAVLLPTLAFAGGMSLVLTAALGAYALSSGLVSFGAGPAV